MRASAAGSNTTSAKRVLDHFESVYNYEGYIRAKYDGLVPDNFPSRKDFKEINSKINYHRLQRDNAAVWTANDQKEQMLGIVRRFNKEWARMQ